MVLEELITPFSGDLQCSAELLCSGLFPPTLYTPCSLMKYSRRYFYSDPDVLMTVISAVTS